MNLILLGCPGAGKGTQASVLCERLGLKHISTGDIFREEISKKTPLGLKVSDYLNAGKLVPDTLVVDVVASRFEGEKGGVLFDGFPRTLEQAEALDACLVKTGRRVDAVIFINISEKEVLSRLTARRGCPKCGRVFNLNTNPPASEGVCDNCGGNLTQREDDTASTVSRRLMVYRDLTQPLVAYYRASNIFHEVDGNAQPQEITARIISLLGSGTPVK
ncbi:MAG: adenylate kinase [bacterium]